MGEQIFRCPIRTTSKYVLSTLIHTRYLVRSTTALEFLVQYESAYQLPGITAVLLLYEIFSAKKESFAFPRLFAVLCGHSDFYSATYVPGYVISNNTSTRNYFQRPLCYRFCYRGRPKDGEGATCEDSSGAPPLMSHL